MLTVKYALLNFLTLLLNLRLEIDVKDKMIFLTHYYSWNAGLSLIFSLLIK